MSKKLLPKSALKEVVIIVSAASAVGLIANFIHPNGVTLSFSRPSLKAVADSILAVDLPKVAVKDEDTTADDQEIGESLIVNTSQVLHLIDRNQAVLLDARSEVEFTGGHIPNAINIPFETFEDHPEKVGSLSENKWLVCYCDGPPCDLGELLAFELMQMGFNHVLIYQEGLNAWKESGGKVEGLTDEK